MRIGLTILILAVLWAPVAAFGEPVRTRGNRGDCRRMTNQINHYENVVLQMAKDRGDKAWEASMELHLAKLKDRRADRCPEYHKQRKFLIRARAQAREIQKYIAMAGRGALKYFTGGWL